MPKLTVTDFVDVVVSSGTPKANKVAQVKNRGDYNPAFDFYKPIRERIVETHKKGRDKKFLRKVMTSIDDKKKLTAYPAILNGHTKWWGIKKLTWFSPARTMFSNHGVDVSVNPELGLKINSKPHVIKLYFKAEPLTKNRLDVILHLMDAALTSTSPKGAVMAVLEVRRSKLHVPTIVIPSLPAVLSAELAYVAALWPNV